MISVESTKRYLYAAKSIPVDKAVSVFYQGPWKRKTTNRVKEEEKRTQKEGRMGVDMKKIFLY